MSLFLSLWHWLMLIMTFTWPIIWIMDWFLRSREPYRQRMRRGKYYCWQIRTFGIPWAFLWEGPIVLSLLGMMFVLNTNDPLYVWWLYVGVGCAVDWITGSDEPPYRRWLASLSDATKKLKISPPPRPIIERS